MSIHTLNTLANGVQRIACRSIDPAEQRSMSFQNLLRFLKDEVLAYSPHYRRKFAQFGIGLDAISNEAEFASTIPFTDKEELRTHFSDFVLQPNWPGAERNPAVEEIPAGRVRHCGERAIQGTKNASDTQPQTDNDEPP